THTHFLGTSSFAGSDLTALTTTVTEHWTTGAIRVYASRSNEATLRALTGFYPYWDTRLTPSVNQTNALDVALDVLNIYNRPIGIFGEAEIWIKPWVPANYLFAFNTAVTKPLVIRTRPSVGTVNRGEL